jgi:hypothetical protein
MNLWEKQFKTTNNMIRLTKNWKVNILYPTDWVIYDKANDNPLQDSYGRVLIFGDKREADDDCRGNENVIRCTDLPIHWQETILKQLNNL